MNIVKRVRASGLRGAGITDLVAVAFSRREEDANMGEAMAVRLLKRFAGLQGLGDVSDSDLTEFTGLEGFEILRSQALIELGRRTVRVNRGDLVQIGLPQDVEEALDYLRFEQKEHFVALLLNAKHKIIRIATIHIGTLSSSLVGAREVFREAVRDGASAVIVAHNHPSGNPEPSAEDIDVTRQLIEAGKMLDIEVLDHVIIGDGKSVSLRARGHIAR